MRPTFSQRCWGSMNSAAAVEPTEIFGLQTHPDSYHIRRKVDLEETTHMRALLSASWHTQF